MFTRRTNTGGGWALIILVITVFLFIFGAFGRPADVSTAPDCQQYLDRAVKAATDIERGLGVSNRQVLALESMAWTTIYNACRGR